MVKAAKEGSNSPHSSKDVTMVTKPQPSSRHLTTHHCVWSVCGVCVELRIWEPETLSNENSDSSKNITDK